MSHKTAILSKVLLGVIFTLVFLFSSSFVHSAFTPTPIPTAGSTSTPGLTPTHIETVTGSSSGSSTVSTSSSVTAASGNLYIVSIAAKPSSIVTGVSGMGLTWKKAVSQCSGRGAQSIDIWYATGNATEGVVTATFGSAPLNAVIAVSRYSNANPTLGNTLGVNTNGINGACSGGTDSASYSLALSANAHSAILTSVAIRRYSHTTSMTELTEIHQGSGGDVSGLAVSNKEVVTSGNQTLSGTLSSASDWSVASIEIKRGVSYTPDPNTTLSASLPGDANGDGRVDGQDYMIWLNHYNQRVSGPSVGDFNANGIVDGVDYIIWLNNYGKYINRTPTPTPVVTPTPTKTPTPTPRPTSTPTIAPTPTFGPTVPPGSISSGIWISRDEIMRLPTSGEAWDRLLSAANSNWGSADLTDNNSNHDVLTLAGALVATRTGNTAMYNKTISGLRSAMASNVTRSLELSRGLQTYIIAADIIGYRTPEFQKWVHDMLNVSVDPHNSGSPCNSLSYTRSCSGIGGLLCTAFNSVNNWGNHARASAIAAAIFLNDQALLNDLVATYRAFTGESVRNSLKCTDTTWHANPNERYGVNRKGSTRDGIHISGVLPEDWRRGDTNFTWPPVVSGYMWEAMQGYVVSAVILHRAGLVPFNSADNSIVRAMDMLYGMGEASQNNPVFRNEAKSDDTWIPWVVNYYAGTSYPTSAANAGKNMGWTDWTHQK